MIKENAKKYIIIAVYCVLLIVSIIFSGMVDINYDVTDYLGEETQTKQALNAINDDFGMTGTMQVMLEGVDTIKANEIKNELLSIDNVLTVTFDSSSESSYKDNTALFVILIDGDDYSEEAKCVVKDVQELIQSKHSTYKVTYGGGVYEKEALQNTITTEMIYILAVSLLFVVIIIMVTSSSWLEPIILLIASGFAVFINKGTNIIFGEISYITNSVSAILQLALSIDYSIVLLHTYRASRAECTDNNEAMKKSILAVIRPVSASALTTIAGLLALLFMSFTVGFDIGIVLIKGIVISLITSITLLPALVLTFDKLLQKASKRAIVIKGEFLSKIAIKVGKVIAPVAIAVIVTAGLLQSLNTYKFTDSVPQGGAIYEKFGQNQSVIVVYEHTEDEYSKELALKEYLQTYKKNDGSSVLASYTSYSTTAGEIYDIAKAQATIGLSESDTIMLYTMYNLYKTPSLITLSAREFFDYAISLTETDSDAGALVDEKTQAVLKTVVTIGNLMQGENTAKEFYDRARALGEDEVNLASIEIMYNFYFNENQIQGGEKIKGIDFAEYVLKSSASNPLIGSMVSQNVRAQLRDMQSINSFLTSEQKHDYKSMTTELNTLIGKIESIEATSSVKEEMASGVYIKYAISSESPLCEPIVAADLLAFVSANMDTNPIVSAKVDDTTRAMVSELEIAVNDAKSLLLGEKYSRILFSVDFVKEGEESFAFFESILTKSHEIFGENAYVAGEIGSTYDLYKTFDRDNLLISVFTAVSIFVIVMVIFKSLSLPVLLVAIIQGAVWISATISLITGPVFFVSHIMTICLLMGATVDYGILMSSNYIELREKYDKKEALSRAVSMALPTVFTSGLILIICGFVISLISTQGAIASVGLLIGKGTLVSVIMITMALPSMLYIFDKLILKLTLKNKSRL